MDSGVDKSLICPACGQGSFGTEKLLIQHYVTAHNYSPTKKVNCPKCSYNFPLEEGFLQQNFGKLNLTSTINKKLPKVGDHILAMWSKSMWQYFHATIRQVMPDHITYEIDWDDGDTTGSYN